MPHYLAKGIDDPRDMLQKLRKKELHWIMQQAGLECPDNYPAILARRTLRQKGIDPKDFMVNGQVKRPERQEAPKEPTIQQLRKHCGEAGIKFSMSDNKAALKEKIEGVQGSA